MNKDRIIELFYDNRLIDYHHILLKTFLQKFETYHLKIELYSKNMEHIGSFDKWDLEFKERFLKNSYIDRFDIDFENKSLWVQVYRYDEIKGTYY